MLKLEINIEVDEKTPRGNELEKYKQITREALDKLDLYARRQYRTLTDANGNNIGSIFYQSSNFKDD